MNSVKYTSDGRKVVVIGKLNATDTIVQEVFVRQDGGEIPSGEHFITKSLHDAPVVSWRGKREKEVAEALARMNREMSDTADRMRKARSEASARIKALSVVATEATRESFRDLNDFVSGRVTHVLQDVEYGVCRIVPFDKVLSANSDYPEDIKLLSLFGRSDGTLQWRLHQYYDFSGNARAIIPARNIEEARQLAQGVFDARTSEWRNGKRTAPPEASRYKDVGGVALIPLIVPDDVTAFWTANRAANKAQRIAKLEKELATVRAET